MDKYNNKCREDFNDFAAEFGKAVSKETGALAVKCDVADSEEVRLRTAEVLEHFSKEGNGDAAGQTQPSDPGYRTIRIAGLGGVLTRIVLIVMTQFTQTRLVYITVAAIAASLYAELWAQRRRDPSTYFLYPAIVPLIPGDLFYYALVGIYRQDRTMFETNALSCLLVLTGMSIGFVISSIIAHQIRRRRHIRVVKTNKTRTGS